MTVPTHGHGTVVVCGACGAEIERALWPADAAMPQSFVMAAFIQDHANAAHHRVTALCFEPLVLAWHELN